MSSTIKDRVRQFIKYKGLRMKDFESYWLTTLVKNYGVSPEYLLLGSGSMFTE